jgi:hypothetical protein
MLAKLRQLLHDWFTIKFPEDYGTYRLFFYYSNPDEKIFIGEYTGTQPEALEECKARSHRFHYLDKSPRPVGGYGIIFVE